MFNAVNILEALKNYIRTRGGESTANNIAEAVNDLNSIPQGSGGISEAPVDGKQYARKDAEWSEVRSSGGDIPDELTNAIETNGMGWTSEEPVPAFNLEWDGNTEGLDIIGGTYFKVSEEIEGITSIDDVVGATVVRIGEGIESPYQITTIDSPMDNIYTDDLMQIIIVTADTEMGQKGVYFAGGEGNPYVSRIYKEASTKEVVHKIDSKYVSSAMIVNLTFVDSDTPITADKTLLELGEAFSNGIPVIARVYAENQLVISAQCVQCDEPYESCNMSFGGAVYDSTDDDTYYPIMGFRKLNAAEETRIDFWECPKFV